MFVVFEKGRCPVCGDFGQKLEKEIFHCSKCMIAFDEFCISDIPQSAEFVDKDWN